MIHLLLGIILFAVGTLASFNCPSASQIFPCECSLHPTKAVLCENMNNLASVRASLEGHFTQTLPRLYLTNLQSFSIPSHALGNLTVRRFGIRDSNIRHIEKDAFDGQTSLGLLILQNDRLKDVPTEALQHLASLRTLSLAENVLIRIQDGSLNNLDSVNNLILSENRISEIGKNAFPKNLDTLVISQNFLSTFNGSLQSLEHLEAVYASNNFFTSIKGEFDGIVRLNTLILDHNQISEISDGFSDLTSIRMLNLAGNLIQDVGKALSGLNQLKFLNLSHNYVTKLDRGTFENLKDLESLDLSGNFLTSVSICPSLKPLRSLDELILSHLALTGFRRDCFHNMTNLMRLDLSHNRLTSADPVSQNFLPALVSLRLDHNRLSDLTYETKYAKNLKYLDISFNNFNSLKTLPFSYNNETFTIRYLYMEGNPWKCTNQTISMLRDLEEKHVHLDGQPLC